MPEKMWDPKDCVKCPLFPAACAYMGAELRSLLCAAVEKTAGEQGSKALQEQREKWGCEGDCEDCSLPDWMKNC